MMRVLLFDGERGAQRFLLLRMALVQAGDGKGERTAPVIRKEARLLDLLDGISEVSSAPAQPGQDPERVLLNHGPHTLDVAQDDFLLLQEYAEKTPWTPRAARQAVDLWDWLSAAERRE